MNMTSKFNRNISGDLFLPFNEIPTISNASHFRWKMGGVRICRDFTGK